MARARPIAVNLLLLAASLLACGLLLEVGARLYVAGSRPQPEATGTPIGRYHPRLGWDKPPGGEQWIRRAEFNVHVVLNAKGLRGPDRPYEKPPGTRRILILGDSFAQGYYVAEEDSARAVLERRLNRAPCAPYEVVNAGTPGYSTDQEYVSFLEEGHRYQPDLVVLFFYFDDLYYNTRTIGPGARAKPMFELQEGRLVLRNVPVPPPSDPESLPASPRDPPPIHGSIALRLLHDRTVQGSPHLHRRLERFGLLPRMSAGPPAEFWVFGPRRGHEAAEVADMWRRAEAILTGLKREVEGQGGRLAVLYVPARMEASDAAWQYVHDRYEPDRPWRRDAVIARLRAACASLGLPLVDPREALGREESAGKRAYFPQDGHWNERGNAIAADALAAFAGRALPCP